MDSIFEYKQSINTPVGVLEVKATNEGICSIRRIESVQDEHSNMHTEQACTQILEYFGHEREQFDLTLDLSMYTPFQRSVWDELVKIPFGKISHYQALAKALGDINKVRAVGAANGANPVPIIIPCHRVVGKNGDLIGYNQGLDMKQMLLEHEKAAVQLNLF